VKLWISSIKSEGVSMTLSSLVPYLLDECATAIVAGKEQDINLTALFPTFCQKGGDLEIVTRLIEAVEYCSDGARSVRLADGHLFKHKIRTIGLYLACCPMDAPTGTVFELTDDILLVRLRPFGNGLTVGAERASYNSADDMADLGLALEAYFASR
jgi:hypothetical protein